MGGRIVRDLGHVTIPVEDMGEALAFYRDLLGFRVVGTENPVWTVVEAKGGQLTLYKTKDVPIIRLGPDGAATPFNFHVAHFERAAAELESRGVRVVRRTENSGVIWDPFGNVLGLHDHLGDD